MMTDHLRAAVDGAADISPEAQDKLAAQIEAWPDALDDARWSQQFADPRSQAVFAEQAAEAHKGPSLSFPTPADMNNPEPGEDAGTAERG